MKAKDYYDKIKDINPWSLEFMECLRGIFGDFLQETFEIIKQRKARTDESILAVYKEQNLKWISFVKLFNDKCEDKSNSLNKEGFKNLLSTVLKNKKENEELIKQFIDLI